MKNQKIINDNIIIHNKIANEYEKNHGEIYNDFEQLRLKNCLNLGISFISTKSKFNTVIDFGAGAGNLTKHLSDLNCNVISCDVSVGFLDLINSKEYPTNVLTHKINGVDLNEISDSSVDMIATYSVLHHVPDYLSLISEFIRVIKPGGIIYIDHEPSDEFWLHSKSYSDFKIEMSKFNKINWSKYFIILNYYDWFIRKFINPRYHREGDIHVFDDDHVEWEEIIKITNLNNLDTIYDESYLLFRRNYDFKTFEKYSNLTSDMRVMIFKKPL